MSQRRALFVGSLGSSATFDIACSSSAKVGQVLGGLRAPLVLALGLEGLLLSDPTCPCAARCSLDPRLLHVHDGLNVGGLVLTARVLVRRIITALVGCSILVLLMERSILAAGVFARLFQEAVLGLWWEILFGAGLYRVPVLKSVMSSYVPGKGHVLALAVGVCMML